MPQVSRRGDHSRRRTSDGNQKQLRTTVDHPLQSTGDARTKRTLKIPRRHECRYTLKSGDIGSKLSLQEVFNRSYAEYAECSYEEDEPLSKTDVFAINRDIRSELYDIKKLQRGEHTFTSLLKKHPVFIGELRGNVEKKWDILQKCKAQWGVDWAIQRVLHRDRTPRERIILRINEFNSSGNGGVSKNRTSRSEETVSDVENSIQENETFQQSPRVVTDTLDMDNTDHPDDCSEDLSNHEKEDSNDYGGNRVRVPKPTLRHRRVVQNSSSSEETGISNPGNSDSEGMSDGEQRTAANRTNKGRKSGGQRQRDLGSTSGRVKAPRRVIERTVNTPRRRTITKKKCRSSLGKRSRQLSLSNVGAGSTSNTHSQRIMKPKRASGGRPTRR